MNEPMTFLDFLAASAVSARALNFAAWSAKVTARSTNSQTAATGAIHDVKEDEWYGEDITNHSGDKAAFSA